MPVPLRHKTKKVLFERFGYLFYKTDAYRRWHDALYRALVNGAIHTSSPKELTPFVPRLDPTYEIEKAAKVICFYLPQFHPIPENDEWWGEGFTEWTNVRSAQPQYPGHYQPRIPGDLGYYDLRNTEVQRKQIELAKLYGIEGFCFYFYWFGGKRLLEKPVENYLNDPSLSLPFCLCWANENWTRRWDGLENDVLIAQNHSSEDDLAFIECVSEYLKDPRYIRIDGRPLLLIYRPDLLPNMRETAERWRTWCRENGIGEIYLSFTLSFQPLGYVDFPHPSVYGLDAAIEFLPNESKPPAITPHFSFTTNFTGNVFDASIFPERSRNLTQLNFCFHADDQGLHPNPAPATYFRGAFPAWDNTARRGERATIFEYASPANYHECLYNVLKDTQKRFSKTDERLVFVNAWNEWAEGAYLEPDQYYGYAYLEATRMAHARLSFREGNACSDSLAIVIHAFYPDVLKEMLEDIAGINKGKKLYITTPLEKEKTVEKILRASKLDYVLMPVNNKGRDVLPFLKIIPQVYNEGHQYILKLHTKKSLHLATGDDWRRDIMHKLTASHHVATVYRLFEENADIGIIGPEGHLVSMGTYWGSNAETVVQLSQRMGVSKETVSTLSFFAGNMFYFKRAALAPLLCLALEEEDFEEERGQLDGTLAHAIERLMSVSLVSAGMRLASIGNVAHDITYTENGAPSFIQPENVIKTE
ncbi:MAG: glycoside hydrolase family 99-like domain-containing protein [Alphaproteobacteria bacterium]|nr:glycoside hydrolase family 99-like domain-containing protein [Alphaproteobacteria bacterium]